MVESTAKLREEIMALSGVDIMLDDNTFKSTYQIMDELSQKWEDLSDIAQASIIELVAGKHRGNVMSSLMSNFDVARSALETSLNSSGSAMQEHEKWSQSLEAQLNKLKAAWQGLSQAFLSSDFLKTALKAVVGLVDGLGNLIEALGVIPTIFTTISITNSLRKKGGLLNLFKVIEDESAKCGKRMVWSFSSAQKAIAKEFSTIGQGAAGESSFAKGLTTDLNALNKFCDIAVNKVDGTVRKLNQFEINDIFGGSSDSVREFALSKEFEEIASASVKAGNGINNMAGIMSAYITKQKQLQVSAVASNKSFSSAKVIIKEYNSGLNTTGNICEKTGLSIGDFSAAVKEGNAGLGDYLSGLNGGKASILKYGASLVGAKIKTIALTTATTLLNAAISMGISAIISLAVSAISKWINAKKELAEKVDEITSKFKEQQSELQKLKGSYDASSPDSMVSKYAKLSKGVDELGRNVSLTSDEYSEYQEIVNTIADQIPSLISGYNEQGNALLSCKDDVELLTAAYEALIRKQNDAVLMNYEQIETDFKNDSSDANNRNDGLFKTKISTNAAEFYRDILEGKEDVTLLGTSTRQAGARNAQYYRGVNTQDIEALAKALEENGFARKNTGFLGTKENSTDFVIRAFEEEKDVVMRVINDFYDELETKSEGMRSAAQAALSNALDISSSDYYGMSDTMKSVAKQIVSGLDYEFFTGLIAEGKSVESYISNMLTQLENIDSENVGAIETAFNLETRFNGGEISYGEYVDGITKAGELVKSGISDTILEEELLVTLGLNTDGFVEEYETLKGKLADSEKFNIMPSEYEDFLRDLSAEELSVAVDVITRLQETDYKETINDIESALRREMMLRGLTFDLNLEVESAGIESLNTALSESVSASGLSSESIKALRSRYADLESQGYDLSTMFEETSHGVHINREEFNKLEKELSKQKLNEINGDLQEMQDAYDQLGEDIRKCTDPVEKAKLFSDRQLLAQRINEAATLASQYEGLTSAYNDWIAAEEAGQERDMYENIISGFEAVDDEISRGWYDDGTIKFLELLTGRTDLVGKSAKELKQIYKDLDKTIQHTSYSVRDFFTVDEDGNSTSKGVYNFLDAIGQMEEEKFGGKDVVKRNDKGNIIGFDFKVAGGNEAIAEALGISEELVQIMTRAANDAGFVVNMDGAYQQFADLENEARAAVNTINKLFGKDYSFDFNTSSVESLNKQLDEAHKILDNPKFWRKDGTYNFDVEGATEAMTIVSTLQARLDTLTQEKYGIGLTVENEEYEEELKNLQEYGQTIATLNQLELNPKANAEDIKLFEEKLNEIATEFNELPDEKKIELGLVGEDGKTPLNNIEDIKDKIEDGKVTIPTVLDIQSNMDKNIEDLKKIALLSSGILDPDEAEALKLEILADVKITPNNVDTSDVEKKTEDAVNEEESEPSVIEKDYEFVAEVTSSNVEKINAKNKEVVDKEESESSVIEKDYELVGEVTGSNLESEIDEKANEIVENEEKGKSVVKKDIELVGEVTNTSDNIDEKTNEFKKKEENKTSVVKKDVELVSEVASSDIDEKVDEAVEKTLENDSGNTNQISVKTDVEFELNPKKPDISEIKNESDELFGGKKYPLKTRLDIKAELGEVDTSDISDGNIDDKIEDAVDGKSGGTNGNVPTGANGRKIGIGVDIDAKANNVDTSDVEKKTEDAIKDKDGKSTNEKIETKTDIEVKGGDVDVSDVDKKIDNVFDGKTATKEGVGGYQGVLKRNANIEFIAKVTGTGDIEKIGSTLKELNGQEVNFIAGVLGMADIELLKKTMNELSEEDQKKLEVIVEAMGKGDVDALSEAVGSLSPKTVEAIAKAFGYEDVDSLKNAISSMDGNVVQAIAQVLGITDVNSLTDAINNLNGKDVKATATTSGKTEVDNLKSSIDGLKGKTITITTIMETVKKAVNNGANAGEKALNNRFKFSNVNGTAHVDGTAFKQGNWRTKKTETALTGELGREIVVTPENRWYTVGDNGAEFVNIPRGSIVFNHKQTEELLKNGKATSDGGRARALFSGTAFLNGTAFDEGTGGDGYDGKESSSVGSRKSSSSSSSSSSADKFEETLDWIETKISRIERAIDKLDQKAGNIYKSWSSRNKSLIKEIGKVHEEIEIQQAAAERYLQEANSVGLSSSWASKVRNGEIDIDTITDEDLADKIGQYEEWYEKYLDCIDAAEELKETEASLYAQRLENVSTQYDGILGVIEHEKNMLEQYISQAEAQGHLVSGEYYKALASNEKDNLAQLKKEKDAMLAELQTAMESGTIEVGSQSWYEMVNSIDEVTLAIAESESQLLEYQQTLQQLSWETFDLLQEKISAVSEEADFLIDLLSNDKLYDDKGQLTDEGKTTMGLHGQNYNSYMYQADLVAEEIERLKKQLEEDPYDTELEARYREMIALQQEYILNAEQEKEAIKDLVSEGIELELDSLSELIDKYNEALDSQKD